MKPRRASLAEVQELLRQAELAAVPMAERGKLLRAEQLARWWRERVREAFVKEDARLSEAQRLQDILAENAKKVSAESKRRAEEERHVKRERQAELQLLSAERKRLGIAAAVTRK